jgi:hypothetical protein
MLFKFASAKRLCKEICRLGVCWNVIKFNFPYKMVMSFDLGGGTLCIN